MVGQSQSAIGYICSTTSRRDVVMTMEKMMTHSQHVYAYNWAIQMAEHAG